MVSLEVKNVVSITHSDVLVGDGSTFAPNWHFETYAGWLLTNFTGGGDVARETVKSFLPTAPGSPNFPVNRYDGISIESATVHVVPSSATYHDTESLGAVDNAAVELKDQTFGGIGGNPSCLVLSVSLAALRATVNRIAYSVTILRKPSEGLRFVNLDPTERPA